MIGCSAPSKVLGLSRFSTAEDSIEVDGVDAVLFNEYLNHLEFKSELFEAVSS